MSGSERIDFEHVLGRGSYSHALLASYELDARFFERFCLERLDALANAGKILIYLDAGKLHRLIHAEPGERPRRAGRRYHLNPASCGGVFHPKVFLLASPTKGLLVVGSCNLTRSGLSSNAELATCLEFERDEKEEHLPLFRDALGLFSAFTLRWGSPWAHEVLHDLELECSWLRELPAAEDPLRPRLLHNLKHPLWAQLRSLAPEPLTRCSVLSPFFDTQPTILDELAEDLKDAELEVFSERDHTTMTPAWLDHPRLNQPSARVSLANYADKEFPQRLHGKALALGTRSRTLLAYGSANFTKPALLLSANDGNCECTLTIPALPVDFDAAALFDPGTTAAPATLDHLGDPTTKPYDRAPSCAILLLEARLSVSNLLVVTTEWAELVSPQAVIDIEDHVLVRVSLHPTEDDLVAALDPQLATLCAKRPAQVRLEAQRGGETVASNTVFLTNAHELGAEPHAIRTRRLRQALEGAELFSEVVDQLLERNDETEFQRFLSNCDIHIHPARHRPLARLTRDATTNRAPRHLVPRLLRTSLNLQAAVTAFLDRHLARLQRHARQPTLDAVVSFMHISRAMAKVASAQLDLIIHGLEDRRPLSAEEWSEARRSVDANLNRVRLLLELLVDGYGAAMDRRYGAPKRHAAMELDVDPLRQLIEKILHVRERIEKEAVPRVRREFGSAICAQFFPNDLLHPTRWPTWSATTATLSRRLLAPHDTPP